MAEASDGSKVADTVSASDGSKPLSGTALWVAVAAVAVWITFSILLVTKASSSDVYWSRVAWVFGSVEAVAFAAAGALFGTAVQKQNVDNANLRADAAQQDADQQRETATKGRALAAALQAEAPVGGEQEESRAMSGSDGPDEVQLRHAQISRTLFGDLF
jgi:hypothetical protein